MTLFFNTDSYKNSQFGALPPDVTGIHDYITGRKMDFAHFGLQGILTKLERDIRIFLETNGSIDDQEKLIRIHSGSFPREALEGLLDPNNGLRIYGVPEGTIVPAGMPSAWVISEHPKYFQLGRWLETQILRVWYPSTIASNGLKYKRLLKGYFNKTVDEENMWKLDWALHSFSGRGVTCEEQAGIADGAHAVNFKGTDTLSSIPWLICSGYANSVVSGSVAASEHTIQCCWGPERQKEYFETWLKLHAKPGAILSVVIDGYDTMKAALMLCTEFKDFIVNSGARVVFRPDSGDPVEIVPWLLRLQAEHFGFITNKKGYDVINCVGVIQGDGVDYSTVDDVSNEIVEIGFSMDNLVFGSGGALMQKVCRDDYGFADKTCSMLENGVWKDVFKDPITDPGKRSISGRLWTKVEEDGSCTLMNGGDIPEEYLRFAGNKCCNLTSIEEVQARVSKAL